MTKRGIRRLIILIVVLALGAGAIGGALMVRRSMNAEEIARAREQGMALYNAGELEAALPLLGKYIGRVKTDPEVLIAFAECRQAVELPNERHFAQAIAALRAAVDLRPDDLEAQERLLELYGARGYLTECIDLAGRILSTDPDNMLALSIRTDALVLLDRYDDAIAAAAAITSQFPDQFASHSRYIDTLFNAGRPIEEQADYMRSIEARFETDPEYLFIRSTFESALANQAEARRFATLAAALPPVSARQAANLVDWLRTLAQEDRKSAELRGVKPDDADRSQLDALADDVLARALADDEIAPPLAIEMTRRAWWASRDSDAAEYAARLDDPALAENEDAKGWTAIIRPSPQRTDERTDQAPPPASSDQLPGQAADGTPWQTIIAARQALNANEHDRVIRSLSNFEPDDPELLALGEYIRGLALATVGDHRAAAVAFANALETGGISRQRAEDARNRSLAALGQRDAPEPTADTLPDLLERQDRQLSRVEASGDTQAASAFADSLGSVMEDFPNDQISRARLARALLIAGRTAEALKEVRTIMDADAVPDSNGILRLANTLAAIDPELANDLLRTLMNKQPRVPLATSLATRLATQGQLAEARDVFEQQLNQAPQDEVLRWRRALVAFLDRFDRTAAAEALADLSDDFKDSAAAQLAVLQSTSAWQDLALARTAVSRLRAISGNEALTWKIYNARAVLLSDPEPNELSSVLGQLTEVLRVMPDDYDALALTAFAYQKSAETQSDPEDVAAAIDLASQHYARAVGDNERAFAFFPYVEMLLEYGREREANAVLDRFLEVGDALPPLARSQRAELLERLRRYDDAIDDQTWITTRNGGGTILNLAGLYGQSGDNSTAVRIIEDFLADNEPTDIERNQIARILGSAGDFDRARRVLEGLPEESELGPRRQVIADFFLNYRRADLALPELTLIARDADNADAWVNAIRAAVAASDAQAQAALLAEAREAFPNAPELAVFDTQASGNRAYSQLVASTIPPDAPPHERALAAIATRHAAGSISDEQLIDELADYSTDHPSNYAAWRLRSVIQGQTGNLAAALETSREAASALPNVPATSRDLARALAAAGRLDEALDAARRFAELSRPDTFQADLLIASLLNQQRDFNGALTQLAPHRARVESQRAESPPTEAFTLYITALAGSGNTDRAFALLEGAAEDPGRLPLLVAAIDILPNNLRDAKRAQLERIDQPTATLFVAEAWLNLAHLSGSEADARTALDIATAIQDGSAYRSWIVAEAAALLGRMQTAEPSYRTVIEKAPDEVSAYLGLAALLAKASDRAEDAIAVADRGLARFQGGSPAALAKLHERKAAALRTLGRTDQARQELSEALRLGPQDPDALISLAELELEAGNSADALALLARVRNPEMLIASLRDRYADLDRTLD